MFITNNRTSFHLWGKKNFLNDQIVSKYYEHDCLQRFVLLFISLLTDLIVKNSGWNGIRMEFTLSF